MDSLVHMMSHVIKKHRERIHTLIQPYEVYPGQPPLLLRLLERDGQSQNELAAHKRVKPATLTVMINRMEATGHLERRSDPLDQRVSRVFLTDKGLRAAQAVKASIMELDSLCFEGFLPEEKLLLRRFLLHMDENLSAAADENHVADNIME
ncbi:MarR family winged helix-turn-helix transcriptional regulator [Paenibacillus thalictri]|nr:MarR family transcriptional regulator [Paenibacillus thalictri]